MLDIAALQNFSLYLFGALGLFVLALGIYVQITPHSEFRMVRDGNVAVALALAGAAIGLALPLASAVLYTGSFVEMMVWASVAVVAQSLVYFVVRWVVPALHEGLSQGQVAHGTVLAGFSISVGLINAACVS